MQILLSRSFYGPNQYTAGAAAYFQITCTTEEASALAVWGSADWNRFGKLLSGIHRARHSDIGPVLPEMVPGESIVYKAAETLAEAVRKVADAVTVTAGAAEYFPSPVDGRIEMGIECADAEVVRRAGVLAVELLNLLRCSENVQGDLSDAGDKLAGLERFAESRRSSLTEAAILQVARDRDLPVIRFDRWPFLGEDGAAPAERRGLMQLGHGAYGKRLRGADTLSALPPARERLGDRVELHGALRAAGVPVPRRDLELTNINSARRSVRSAERIGYPVVLKPQRGGHCVGVNLSTAEAVAYAYSTASQYDRHVVIEHHIAGNTYRLLVIGGKVVAASWKPQPNDVPLRALAVDPEDLCDQVKAAAVKAAGAFGLDVAGVDIVTADIAAPLETAAGAVIGVTPSPDLGLHCMDGELVPLTAAGRLLQHLFPSECSGRIPIVAVTGSAGKTTTCRMVARILGETGRTVGLACTDGVYVGRTMLNGGVYSGIAGAVQVFMDARVDIAVLEVSRGTLVQKGLGFDWATVGACTKVQPEHLGLDGIETVAEMARLKRVVVEHAKKLAVLNAADSNCLAMLPYLSAERVCLVSTDPSSDSLRSAMRDAVFAVVLEGAQEEVIRVWEGSAKDTVISVPELPAAWGGAARHNVENAMFATAIALGMGVGVEVIRQALTRFGSSAEDAPNRINLYDRLPFRVVLDRAGTSPGYQVLCDFVDRLKPQGRRILAFYGTGDRRDADLREVATRVARSFDRFVCFDGLKLRGRRRGEVPELMKSVLCEHGVCPKEIFLCAGKEQAVQQVLAIAAPGDFVVIASGSEFNDIIQWLDLTTNAVPTLPASSTS